jgi:hypothetical protein
MKMQAKIEKIVAGYNVKVFTGPDGKSCASLTKDRKVILSYVDCTDASDTGNVITMRLFQGDPYFRGKLKDHIQTSYGRKSVTPEGMIERRMAQAISQDIADLIRD